MTPAKSPPGASPRGRATLRDVARVVGVSVATVSNAYNRPDQLSAELRERVLAAARDLGYPGPDPLARSLRRGKSGVIGVVYDAPLEYAFADPAASLFLGSVSHTLQAEELNLLLLAAPSGSEPVRTAGVDGLIVYSAPAAGELLEAVYERRLPTVLVDQGRIALPATLRGLVTQVGVADEAGARAAAAHLAGLGHRRIGVLALEAGPGGMAGPMSAGRAAQAEESRVTGDRLRGYRAGAPDAALICYECPQNLPAEGEAQARALLTAWPEVTALLCMSDVLAQGAYQAAQALGRRIPEDLSLVGYDDVPASAALGLTTVWQPTADKGRVVGETLLRLLAGRAAPGTTLPTRLTVRGSTGPASQETALRASRPAAPH